MTKVRTGMSCLPIENTTSVTQTIKPFTDNISIIIVTVIVDAIC